MGARKFYMYEGKKCSVSELERLSGLPRHILQERLDEGWDVSVAVNTPKEVRSAGVAPEWEGKVLEVVFRHYIPQVFNSMQPQLSKPYIAHPHTGSNVTKRSKLYYTIQLDNGKPLIVYPNEFEIVAEAPSSTSNLSLLPA